jgi:hypothetical protein
VNEKSPYLLQHANNPVDWFPWGEEAFLKAKEEDKPVFLSIGYSTCHWCHVMERESFEDVEVARLLNEVFVAIKVDREERPDIDGIYMTVCQLMTGSGGWPLTVVMTPEKEPFFSGTYFPKQSQMGRIGMIDLIPKIQAVWEDGRDSILESAAKVTEVLTSVSNLEVGESLTATTNQLAYAQLSNTFDEVRGGFGTAPKFPSPHNLIFLLRYWARTGEERALQIVEKTLEEMRKGGVFDQIGFGFHRYSTDREWLLPHFEKMLYDQAMLTLAFTEAHQATHNPEFKKTSEEVIQYVIRDMTSSVGAYYSAEDADSEGEEGKFYVWDHAELQEVLGQDDSELLSKIFNVRAEGNFIDEASRKRTGANILHLTISITEFASEFETDASELKSRVEKARQKLFDVRELRIHPYKDDKILVDWNGLMIAAMAKAGRVFENQNFIDAAKRALKFVEEEMRIQDGSLLHRHRDGEAAIEAFLDDYVFLMWGALELFEATFEFEYLALALKDSQYITDHFWDEGSGGFFFSSEKNEMLLARKKEIYDGAVPSGNSVAMNNLLRLARLTGDSTWEQMALALGKTFSHSVEQAPSAHSHLLTAVEFMMSETLEVVVIGTKGAVDTEQMLSSIRSQYLPNVTLLFVSADEISDFGKLIPFVANFNMLDGKATAYVCRNFSCDLPTTDIDVMMQKIDEFSEN